MFLRTDNPTELEGYINSAFRSIRKQLVDEVHDTEFKETAIRGVSDKHREATQYHTAIMLCVLVWLDVDRSYTAVWTDLVTKYKLEKFKESYACIGISLDNLLVIFGLPTVGGIIDAPIVLGIENLGIEETFEVEPPADSPISPLQVSLLSIPVAPDSTVDIKVELAKLTGCTETNCN